ncbi:HNH endonuclease [Cupriavidus taiwanensis]|uniref:HNH endonuclease n=1 Tax=Cupriavidus taiwanensis TaxID=164546 RepID=UPI000E106482|nr:HNH endonuclease [Cupriavidus taiwanensis]SOY48514.1 conserved hypothetical protein [Cupriavidus taiwanensis]SOY83044.1 conserved hypothetical protein [Cupriavidus taiwanensis]SOZ56229.1 conserved hypothetical protein [Cupriavidus taiwanensis]SOZ78813.1 conserved hypothetical protein [Cupriavidus taiwanensis]SOZ79088.1 conserved hypothetical protein [Cupriavidus taiwanensis]
MTTIVKFPAGQALDVIDGPLASELGIHRFDGHDRSKAQLFAIGGPKGKQFAIVLGNTDIQTGQHPAQQTRILLERCTLPMMPGIEVLDAPYEGSRIKTQRDSRLASPNQVSCLVADEASLAALLRWYAGRERLEPRDGAAAPWHPLELAKVEKAAVDAGFDVTPLGEGNWLIFRCSAFPQIIGVSQFAGGSYRVGFSDADWGRKMADDFAFSLTLQNGPWPAWAEAVAGYETLHRLLVRAARVARVMSGEAIGQFEAEVRTLPLSTEAERLVVQRVGQNLFRNALVDYWQGRCAVTGLEIVPLLRASHIKPWAECESDAERLDVFNGLLLAPHLDALFDGGWISFSDGGALLVSRGLSAAALKQLGVHLEWGLETITSGHKRYLAYHRENVFHYA